MEGMQGLYLVAEGRLLRRSWRCPASHAPRTLISSNKVTTCLTTSIPQTRGRFPKKPCPGQAASGPLEAGQLVLACQRRFGNSQLPGSLPPSALLGEAWEGSLALQTHCEGCRVVCDFARARLRRACSAGRPARPPAGMPRVHSSR